MKAANHQSSTKCHDCGWPEGHASGCSQERKPLFERVSASTKRELRVTLSEPNTTASDVLQTAASLVSGDRAKTHGDKTKTHQNIADLWGAYLGIKLTPEQVALMMALLKIARTKGGTHNPDDYIDLAGYAGVAAEIASQKSVLTSSIE